MKGETIARIGLRLRVRMRSTDCVSIFHQARQPEEHPHKEPRIRIHQIILISNQSVERHDSEQVNEKPEQCEAEREESSVTQAFDNFPGLPEQHTRPNQPKYRADNSQLQDQLAITAFGAKVRPLLVNGRAHI